MTLRLTVERDPWWRHAERVARDAPGLVPVVKGKGYGFGRARLAELAGKLADTIAVGTVHELAGLPAGLTPVVLTPSLRPPVDPAPILTVGSLRHIAALDGWRGRVLVKLASSMRRYGTSRDELGAMVSTAQRSGLEVVGFSVHPPVAGSDDEHLDDIAAWMNVLDPTDEVWVSHLSLDGYAALRDAWPDHRFRIRLGTALWHGDKRYLQLGADVLDVRPTRVDDRVGYRQLPVPCDGHLVMVGAGTAHGVQARPDGLSPLHFGRRRLALLEPPHMHTSMVVVPSGEPMPAVGQWIDVQCPLITAYPDEWVWTDG
ncbi:MAG: alanine racemase [Ilumatobacteraceae bacterium]